MYERKRRWSWWPEGGIDLPPGYPTASAATQLAVDIDRIRGLTTFRVDSLGVGVDGEAAIHAADRECTTTVTRVVLGTLCDAHDSVTLDIQDWFKTPDDDELRTVDTRDRSWLTEFDVGSDHPVPHVAVVFLGPRPTRETSRRLKRMIGSLPYFRRHRLLEIVRQFSAIAFIPWTPIGLNIRCADENAHTVAASLQHAADELGWELPRLLDEPE